MIVVANLFLLKPIYQEERLTNQTAGFDGPQLLVFTGKIS